MLLKRQLFSAIGLAMLGLALLVVAGTEAARAASQETFITVVIQKGSAPGLVIGYRTSDPGANFVNCTITGSSQTCSRENTNSSTKNLGNIICLPASNAKYTVSARCQGLLNNGAGSCQTNSSSSQCPSGTTAVFPVCNYRTSSNMSNAAYWVWNVGTDTGVYDIDCLQAGYQGPNPK